MAKKKVQAKNEKSYLVIATADGFEYKMDHASRNPHVKSAGTSPTGLLLTSLAGCQVMTARSFLDRQKIQVAVLEIEVTGNFSYNGEAWMMEAVAVLKTDAVLNQQQKDYLLQFIERFCTVSGVLNAGENNVQLSIEQV